jgi:hypothetical protein
METLCALEIGIDIDIDIDIDIERESKSISSSLPFPNNMIILGRKCTPTVPPKHLPFPNNYWVVPYSPQMRENFSSSRDEVIRRTVKASLPIIYKISIGIFQYYLIRRCY